LVGALTVNQLIVILGNKSQISIEHHQVNSIIVLELTFQGVSAPVSYCETFQVELEGDVLCG